MEKTNQENSSSSQRVDFYRVVTRRIIEELQQGKIPWRRTLSHPYTGFAKNFFSSRKYRGINWLLLNLMTSHEVPFYLTWNQVQKLGGNVLKGTKANEVFYFNSYYRNRAGHLISVVQAKQLEARHEEVQRISYLKKHHVFNIAYTRGIVWEAPEERHKKDVISHCDLILDALKEAPILKHQEDFDAYYNPVLDHIVLPKFKAFNDPETYYVLLFHHLIHWTGNIKRLARPGIMDNTLGETSIYVEESLIAELGACMLTAIVGIEQLTQLEEGSDYISSWLQALEEDKRFIFRVASRAQQAVDYILEGRRG
ncbi:ArdC family protein [Aureispira sp. CCB-QB1]|uniref:ArdC family protein n=1 Tax=Aureispira sp. CCB-QB1 TaxID=1313421 RepID=UPI00069767F6|nr:zincin-like metallopeptidase domain-containing protein [Aureispira sp. CCB-QB1]